MERQHSITAFSCVCILCSYCESAPAPDVFVLAELRAPVSVRPGPAASVRTVAPLQIYLGVIDVAESSAAVERRRSFVPGRNVVPLRSSVRVAREHRVFPAALGSFKTLDLSLTLVLVCQRGKAQLPLITTRVRMTPDPPQCILGRGVLTPFRPDERSWLS